MNNSTNSTTQSQQIFDTSFILIHGANFILGLPLNVYIMFLHFGKRSKLDPSDISTFNQAAAEIVFMIVSPFHCMCGVSEKLCFLKPRSFFFGCGMTARSLFKCLVCLEHYVAVVHPVTFLKFRPLRYRIVHSIISWTISLGSGITAFMTYPDLPYRIFIVMYLMVLILASFSCLSVLKKLKHPGPGNGDKKGEDGAKKRAFKIITFNLVAFLIQNIPVTVCFGLQDKLSTLSAVTAKQISLSLDLFVGLVQAVFMLHRAGKLSFMNCTWF